VDAVLDGVEKHFLPQIEFTPQVNALLARLAAKDID
jgi:hypothetical protein